MTTIIDATVPVVSTLNPAFAEVRTFGDFVKAFESSPVPCKTKMGHNDYLRAWNVLGAAKAGSSLTRNRILYTWLSTSASSFAVHANRANMILRHVGVCGLRDTPLRAVDKTTFVINMDVLNLTTIPEHWLDDEEEYAFTGRGRPKGSKDSAPRQPRRRAAKSADEETSTEYGFAPCVC